MRAMQVVLFLIVSGFPAVALPQTTTTALHGKWDFKALFTRDTEDGNSLVRTLMNSYYHASFHPTGRLVTQGRGGPTTQWKWRVLSEDDERSLSTEIVDEKRKQRTIAVRFLKHDVIAISGLIPNCTVTYRRRTNP